MSRRNLKIWYISPLRRCNFRCAYCVSGQPRIKDRDEWAFRSDAERHGKVMEWIASLPFRIKLRLSSIGEPFTSEYYLSSVARLSRAENIDFLEVLTNGSFTRSRIKRLAEEADLSKLRLWMTFHPTQMSLERFLEAALLARGYGVQIIAHALLFPDSINAVRALKEGCESHDLRLHIGLGLNFNRAYPNRGFVPVLSEPPAPREVLDWNVGFGAEVYEVAEAPAGRPCSAGHDYIYIDTAGGVHRCRAYSLDPERRRLGSVLDPEFSLNLRTQEFAACRAKTKCVCTEDHQHLAKARSSYRAEDTSFVPWSRSQFFPPSMLKDKTVPGVR